MSVNLKGLRRFAFAMGALATLASCGDDGGAAPVEAAEFCDAYVDTICGSLDACCSGTFNLDQCRLDQYEECEQNILTLDDRGIAPSGPNTPARIVFDFDEEGAGEALAQLKGQLSQCRAQPLEQSMFDATHVLGEPGAECLRNEDCVEGTRCEHPPLAVFGTCVIAPLPGELCEDICAYREDQCVIDPADGRGLPVCVAPRGQGQTCDIVGCKAGLICGMGRDSFEPTCMPGGQPGASCVSDDECVSGFCNGGECSSAVARYLCTGIGIDF